jgi:hypothetical protein
LWQVWTFGVRNLPRPVIKNLSDIHHKKSFMQTLHPTIKQSLIACLLLAPLLQLLGDSLWVSQDYPFSWSLWREASFIFFIPTGFLLARLVAPKSATWAVIACGFYVVGCIGVVAMMPLFRLGAFYPVQHANEFPTIVQSVLDKGAYAATLFFPGLCFPVSLVLFGIAFLKHRVLPRAFAASFILAGILFWFGNAMEINPIMVTSDIWLLLLFCGMGYIVLAGNARHRSTELATGV